MLEITEANALDYLRGLGQLPDGPVRVEALSGGVSNVVLRVDAPSRSFVLKQSRPQLRTRDAWFSDVERVFRELAVMRALHGLLPGGVVPEVLFEDRENFAFAMTAAPCDARPWKTLLLAGAIDPALGGRAGDYLGRLHEATATRPTLVEPFRDHRVFVQLRADPFYRRVEERRPELAAEVRAVADDMLARKEALCHGDYTPKNMLVHGGGFTLVDYETACLGDPTMDVGLFLCHLLLKAVHRPDRRQDFFTLTRRFWSGYAAEVRFRPLPELEARGLRHCAVCLLARVDGTSPVDYLPGEPQQGVVRALAGTVLQDRVGRWEDVLALCDRGLAGLSNGR